jgi:hypothetical protein
MTLQLPMNYVDVDREEMEYVDGGSSITQRWYGYDVYFTASQCDDLAAACAEGCVTEATIAGICGFACASVAAAPVAVPLGIASLIDSWIMGTGSAYFWYASNHGGVSGSIINNVPDLYVND